MASMTRVFTGLAVALLGTVLLGSDAGPYDLVFEDLAPGVFVASRPDAIRLPVEGNVTVVIGDRGVVVMDAGGSPASARQVIAEIRRRTAVPVRYLVNSHGHYDHVAGNHEFVKAFAGVEIVGGPGLRDYMAGGGLDYVRTLPASLEARQAEAERSLAAIRARAAAGDEPVVAYLRRWIDRDLPEQARQFRETVIELPTATVGDRLAFDAGGRRVEVRHLGFGKSGSDLVLWLPDDRIVAAGDTLTEPIPYGFSRKPLQWLDTLRALAALDADVIVPGHGEVQRGGAYLAGVIDLVERTRARILDLSRQGRDLDGIAASIDMTADARSFVGDDPVARRQFRAWFTEPFVDRVVGEAGLGPTTARPAGEVLFADDFEGDLSKWELGDASVLRIVDSGDPGHGGVFEMAPASARLAALMRGSEGWRGYRVEGDVLFPENVHNYLGFVYHYRATERRVDLGSLYIKGNGSYVRVNPRRDWNPARQMYEEYRTALTGPDAIRIGQWQHFAAEVVGPACHFYVGDMAVPKVTFDFYEAGGGKAGFKPRVVGGRVWLDNVRVRAIDALSYVGAPRPDGIGDATDGMITDWRVLGPLTRAAETVERAPRPQDHGVVDDGAPRAWRAFETDPRGAVVTGRVTEFLGSRTVAYFHTTITVPEGETARVAFSSIDDLALWLDGRFDGYLTRGPVAWHDAGVNPDHPPTDAMSIGPGTHELLIRVRGGQYATGGFFARLTLQKTALGRAQRD